jgi:hypothetical protein
LARLAIEKPYGISLTKDENKYLSRFDGGIGEDCYSDISKAIGGAWMLAKKWREPTANDGGGLMICFSIYSRNGSFVCRFEDRSKAERWRQLHGIQEYVIRKEVWR